MSFSHEYSFPSERPNTVQTTSEGHNLKQNEEDIGDLIDDLIHHTTTLCFSAIPVQKTCEEEPSPLRTVDGFDDFLDDMSVSDTGAFSQPLGKVPVSKTDMDLLERILNIAVEKTDDNSNNTNVKQYQGRVKQKNNIVYHPYLRLPQKSTTEELKPNVVAKERNYAMDKNTPHAITKCTAKNCLHLQNYKTVAEARQAKLDPSKRFKKMKGAPYKCACGAPVKYYVEDIDLWVGSTRFAHYKKKKK
eukprot:gene4077-7366_t